MDSALDPAEQKTFSIALMISVIAHVMLAVVMLIGFGRSNNFSNDIVYSVTLEGGKTLGGRSQVQTSSKTTAITPPKNTTSKTDEVVKPDPKVAEERAKEKAEADAEVSLAEKKKEDEIKKRAEEEKQKLQKKKEEDEKKAEQKAEQKKKDDEEKRKKEEDDKKKELAKKKAEAAPADVSKDYQKALQRYLGESNEGGGKGFGAAKVGGNAMGGGVVMPPEFFTYRQILRNKVKSGWNWFNTNAALTSYFTFEIARDGTISNVQLAQSSGNREFDDSVERAIHKASPLPPPPASVFDYFKSVKMDFDPRD